MQPMLAVAICALPPLSIEPSARVLSEGFFDPALAAQDHAACDAAVREAMKGPRPSVGTRLEAVVDTIHANADCASVEVLNEARALRAKLREEMRARTTLDRKMKTPAISASTMRNAMQHAPDDALRNAIESNSVDVLTNALHVYANAKTASPEVVKEARALRDKLRGERRAAPTATGSSDVEFVVVAASPRSASTAVAEEVADHRCSISFNEMFNTRQGDLWHPQSMQKNALGCLYPGGAPCSLLQGGCNSRWYHQRLWHMLPALNLTRNAWCGRPGNGGPNAPSPMASCNGKCVVAIKMFGPDMFRTPELRKKFDSYAPSFEELIAYKGTRLVMVERDAADDECSYNYSRASGRWHGGNKQVEHSWKAQNCHAAPSAQFASAHTEWYAWLREKAAQYRKDAFELPFKTYITDPLGTRQKLHALAGLPAGPEFEQPNCGHTPTLHQSRKIKTDAHPPSE